MKDVLIKFLITVPLVSISARTIDEAFLRHYLQMFYATQHVLIGQGSDFISSLID